MIPIGKISKKELVKEEEEFEKKFKNRFEEYAAFLGILLERWGVTGNWLWSSDDGGTALKAEIISRKALTDRVLDFLMSNVDKNHGKLHHDSSDRLPRELQREGETLAGQVLVYLHNMGEDVQDKCFDKSISQYAWFRDFMVPIIQGPSRVEERWLVDMLFGNLDVEDWIASDGEDTVDPFLQQKLGAYREAVKYNGRLKQ